MNDRERDERNRRRSEAARHYLRRRHAGVLPDADFAARVTRRLERHTVDQLGWTALKLLPATLALVGILAWLSWSASPASATAEPASPTEDLLAWVLEQESAAP